jgi:NADH-quinone oxidoreductase subunit A
VEQGSVFAWVAFGELFLFVAILLVGLVWVWAHGDLAWVKNLAGASYAAPTTEGETRRAA